MKLDEALSFALQEWATTFGEDARTSETRFANHARVDSDATCLASAVWARVSARLVVSVKGRFI